MAYPCTYCTVGIDWKLTMKQIVKIKPHRDDPDAVTTDTDSIKKHKYTLSRDGRIHSLTRSLDQNRRGVLVLDILSHHRLFGAVRRTLNHRYFAVMVIRGSVLQTKGPETAITLNLDPFAFPALSTMTFVRRTVDFALFVSCNLRHLFLFRLCLFGR